MVHVRYGALMLHCFSNLWSIVERLPRCQFMKIKYQEITSIPTSTIFGRSLHILSGKTEFVEVTYVHKKQISTIFLLSLKKIHNLSVQN